MILKNATKAVVVQNHEPWEVPVGENGTDVFNFNHAGYVPRAVKYEELEELSQLEMIENDETHETIIEGGASPASNCFQNSIFDSIRTNSVDTKNF
jgi:hypothetical protein